MRRAAHLDGNHGEIVAALRAVGCLVQSLAGVGDGVPDLLVGYRRQVWLLEIKDGAKVPSKRKLTPAEQEWHSRWAGYPVRVVESVTEALAAVGYRAEGGR